MSIFGSKPLGFLEKALDATSLRQKVLANNVANVDTPDFKRSDVSFADQLQSFLSDGQPALPGKRTDPRHLPIGTMSIDEVSPRVYTDNSTTVSNNGNNVNIDLEMTRVAANQLQYETLVEQLSQQFSRLRTAINGGGN